MSDRSLLEDAAKAAGIELKWDMLRIAGKPTQYRARIVLPNTNIYPFWNPLEDDGDALRLAVKLGLELDFSNGSTAVADPERYSATYTHEFHAGEAMARTRLCIVRAAAAIAKGEK